MAQFNPQLGDLAHNLGRAEAIISRANPTDLDLLVLPEMAFSGASAPRPGAPVIPLQMCQ